MSIQCPTHPESPPVSHDRQSVGRGLEDTRGRTIFGDLKRLVSGYLALSLVTLVVIAVLRNDRGTVNSAVWMRATIVALSALLTVSFAVRAARGSARSFLRLRIVSAVMLVAIVVIIAVPGTFPLWMKLEQAACGLLLVSVVGLVNDDRRAASTDAVESSKCVSVFATTPPSTRESSTRPPTPWSPQSRTPSTGLPNQRSTARRIVTRGTARQQSAKTKPEVPVGRGLDRT